jgi:DNA mismatch endonuclease (patch repair protein)
MTDKFDKPKRSEIMSRVRGADTKPEMAVRRVLFGLGFRYRLHRKDLPGTPDIVLPKYRLVINVNGCFWHGCPHCRHARVRPESNKEYWNEKLDRNMRRDKENQKALEALGWRTLVVWECEIKKKNLPAFAENLKNTLLNLPRG